MAELKPCPFCGGEIEIKENVVRESFAYIECECSGCHMEFAHQQDFTLSKYDRRPINDDFLTVWNRRKGKTGHWKAYPDEYQICGTEFVCSNCNESFVNSELASDNDFLGMMKYCPNCGADMRERKDND